MTRKQLRDIAYEFGFSKKATVCDAVDFAVAIRNRTLDEAASKICTYCAEGFPVDTPKGGGPWFNKTNLSWPDSLQKCLASKLLDLRQER